MIHNRDQRRYTIWEYLLDHIWPTETVTSPDLDEDGDPIAPHEHLDATLHRYKKSITKLSHTFDILHHQWHCESEQLKKMEALSGGPLSRQLKNWIEAEKLRLAWPECQTKLALVFDKIHVFVKEQFGSDDPWVLIRQRG